jgi:hypothetical protein
MWGMLGEGMTRHLFPTAAAALALLAAGLCEAD